MVGTWYTIQCLKVKLLLGLHVHVANIINYMYVHEKPYILMEGKHFSRGW